MCAYMRQGLAIAFVSCSVSLQSKAEGTQYSQPLVLFVAVSREGDMGITELAQKSLSSCRTEQCSCNTTK